MPTEYYPDLHAAGLNAPAVRSGKVYLRCPECAHEHSRTGAAKRCLTLWPEGNWLCNRCGWKGKVGGPRMERTAYVEPEINVRPAPKFDAAKVEATLKAYDLNALIYWLAGRIGWEAATEHARAWRIGTAKNGDTLFWHCDKQGRYRAGKRIQYDPLTAKKTGYPSWVPLDGQQIPLFGLWQLQDYGRAVLLVESEKSAFLGSLLPEMAGFCILATGGASGLTDMKIPALTRQHVRILPDADAAGLAAYVDADGVETERVKTLRTCAASVEVLNPEDLFGPDLPAGYDLGDYAADWLNAGNYSRCKALQSTNAVEVDTHTAPAPAIDYGTHWADGVPMPAHLIDFYADAPEPVEVKPAPMTAAPEPVELWQAWTTSADIPLDANHADITRWIAGRFAAGGIELQPVESEPEAVKPRPAPVESYWQRRQRELMTGDRGNPPSGYPHALAAWHGRTAE